MQVRSPGWGDPLEEETAAYSSILAWRSPGTEEPTVHRVSELDTAEATLHTHTRGTKSYSKMCVCVCVC